MPVDYVFNMLAWLAELAGSSFLLAYGAEHLSAKYGGRFVGRTLMSIATTLPEIAIVVYAAADGFYGVALGAGLGSNLLMMTLGLSLMLLIATTRLSKSPLKGVDVRKFKLDKAFLLGTSVLSAVLFLNGYDYIDGFIFTGLFFGYVLLAYREMRIERRSGPHLSSPGGALDRKMVDDGMQSTGRKGPARPLLKAALVFVLGTLGILLGAHPFIESLEGLAVSSGVSVIVLAVVISPIAGEMPEKISMMILARKGEGGASIAVANVLGSKILNNTLLLAVAVFGAMYHEGFFALIALTPILGFQTLLVTSVTAAALVPMLKKEIGLRVGAFLMAMYVASILLQFQLPQSLIGG